MFLKLLGKHNGRLTTKQIENELGCSTPTATKTMRIFEVLDIVTIKIIQIDNSGVGQPMHYIEIKSEFESILLHTQGRNDLKNNTLTQTTPVCDGNIVEETVENE